MTVKLDATLNNCKISGRDAVRIITATPEVLYYNLDELIINCTLIQRYRHRFCAERTKKLRETFQLNSLLTTTIHWDLKMLPSTTNTEYTDRLPAVITYDNMEKLLSVLRSQTVRNGTNIGNL